ncbi:MAG: DNA gyrase inhibitor YacG [Sandaracinaceae bacterium]|nr:DNA gyrase inhibitor YacG [Sandaracinaceae bacterium]
MRACPSCGRPAETRGEAPHAPFCSARCRLIDLGSWLDEAYRIPAETAEGTTPGELDARDEP